MAATPSELIAEKFRTTLELFELGEAMLRQKLRRKHPSANDDEIEALVQEWRERRPGAEHGDGVGRPIAWPRAS
jgi:Rv0078B-related antitoxin